MYVIGVSIIKIINTLVCLKYSLVCIIVLAKNEPT